MKKYLLLPLFAMSSGAFANYYIGAEYGYTNIDQDNSTKFFNHHVTVHPKGSTDTAGLFIGYRFNDRLGWELGYTQYDIDDSHDRFESITNVAGIAGIVANEFKADLKAQQITLKPVYFMPLNESFSLKTGLGLSLTRYKFRSSARREFDALLIDDLDLAAALHGGEKKSKTAIGGIASIGLDYNLTPKIALGVAAQYQFDKVAQASSLKATAAYYF